MFNEGNRLQNISHKRTHTHFYSKIKDERIIIHNMKSYFVNDKRKVKIQGVGRGHRAETMITKEIQNVVASGLAGVLRVTAAAVNIKQ